MRIENENVLNALPELGVELKPGTSLAEITYLGIGGSTDLLLLHRHDSIPDVVKLLGLPDDLLRDESGCVPRWSRRLMPTSASPAPR